MVLQCHVLPSFDAHRKLGQHERSVKPGSHIPLTYLGHNRQHSLGQLRQM